MATNLPSLQTPQTLFASVDMGTNSFKLLIIRAYPSGKFFTLDRVKEPVTLGRDFTSSLHISSESFSRSIESLLKFRTLIEAYKVEKDQTRVVATAAARDAKNKEQFVKSVEENVGFEVDVLSGEEEAEFVYLGMLQFLPVYDKLVLGIDIGGGSTEFVVGKRGKIVFCESLRLGHVGLSEKFGTSEGEVEKMRKFIRMVVTESGLVERVRESGFEVAVGCSGTIRALEKAVFNGYDQRFVDNVGVLGVCKRDWRLSREGLKSVVERLCSGGGDGERVRKESFFKRRSEFIVAGAVLLDEIFELLGIEEMEVSGYGLAEGVIADSLAKIFDGYDLNANARWRSVVRLAMRFSGTKKMKSAAQCASIAKDIFDGLRKCDELANIQVKLGVSLDNKDLEFLEAACLLHNIGLFISKKGYHKKSCEIIMNGDHLYGYSTEEIKLIALLTRYHRKKFPKFSHSSLKEFSGEVIQKFKMLCAILRLSVILQQNESVNLQEMEVFHSHEGFKLVIQEVRDRPSLHGISLPTTEDIGPELRQELEYFNKVFKQELLIIVPSSSSSNSIDKATSARDVDHL
ncbi:uncharacterized protein LOC116114313 isoform X1 [Pistacia vera]|uniref:uncharacterized protein LOC116114313 isoform X1 n=2 Tax=Pistacia vera TaxID=55513 RepID=UPI0012637F33|nr:uncharacterized protein LOC116114313 isoform X1 [Pistacia vera]